MGKKKRKKARQLSDESYDVWVGETQDVINRLWSYRAAWYAAGHDERTVEIGGAEFVVINAGENEDLT